MRPIALLALLTSLLFSSQSIFAASESCLGCHDYGPESPVHPMQKGPHSGAEQGCAACHGPSEDHQKRPTIASPDVSFGPRWSTAAGEQDASCLACHADNVAGDWQDSLHMANNMSCIACHDLHTPEDRVLGKGQQVEVCGVCHKVQQDGIHALKQHKADNPDCSNCHNPHADQSPTATMLSNRSEGCRSCHDLVAMAADPQVSARATSFHKVMARKDRSCVDCHQGVAHGPTDAVQPFVPLPASSRVVTLFYPGQSDIDWILSEHPGSQPFRQGTNCRQCHRGEEGAMGSSLGGEDPASRQVSVRFRSENDMLEVEISWAGNASDTDIAMMWGDGGNSAFRRGGCWAACHSDMPGMSRDRGLGLGKYLSVSRQQTQRIGQPPLNKDAADLEQLMAAGDFVNMWRVDLASKTLQTATLLATPVWQDQEQAADVSFAAGKWTVKLSRPLVATQMNKNFVPGGRYTFGLALHGEGRGGAGHWVSLPMTMSLDGNDTDFLVE